MNLNEIGRKANEFFSSIPVHFLNSEIDYYVVMPNHVHGIIIINSHVEPCHGMALQTGFGKPQKNSLSMIVNHYKGAVTNYTRKNEIKSFSWQSRFYDHIIRNEKDLYRIREYIRNNPLKWELDEYYDN